MKETTRREDEVLEKGVKFIERVLQGGYMTDSMRNSVGFIPVLKGGSAADDNLAIALCTYFSNHPERPDDDEEDEQTGWGEWVIEKADDLIDRVIRNVLDEKAMQRKGTAVSSAEKQSEGKAL